MKKSLTHYKSDFLDYLGDVKKSSNLTLKTYDIALRQMLDHADIESDNDHTTIYLMPFRKMISKQNKKTISKKLSAIRSFVSYLKEVKHLDIILRDDESIKTVTSLPKPIEHRHIEQALKLASADEKLLVIMLYSLGLRISELAGLELKNIKSQWIRVTGKGEKMRDIPLSVSLKKEMDYYCTLYTPKTFFFEKDEVKLSEDSLRYKLRKIFKRISLNVTPHQLRHSYATALLNGGARIEDVSELLGHESLATTQIYTQLASDLKMASYNSAHPLQQRQED
jgi:integrase/recombinase XerC